MGSTGELVIGGVGLARYLDVEKDAQKYAPLPSMGWDRAYRSGDMVRAVQYSGYTVNYCPTCQTAGRVLADNTTSKFLK